MTTVVYFWHIPKTAGTSITHGLVNSLTHLQIYPGNTLDGLFQNPPRESGLGLFCGHFGSYLPLFGVKPATTFTVLRNPVEQVWSYYRFTQRIPEFGLPGGLQGRSLEELLDHEVYSRMFTNLQARWLALDTPPVSWHGVPSVSSFTMHSAFELQDLGAHGLGDPQVLQAKAQARLDSLTVTGVTDDLNGLFDRLRQAGLAVTWPDVRHNGAPDHDPPPRPLVTRIEKANAVDLSLHAGIRGT